MMRLPLVWFIRFWRAFISPLYGDVCRYYPTCSAYGLRAVEFHGAIKGSYLTARRILSCHPWSPGGVEFVPGTPEAAAWDAEQARRRATTMTEPSSGPAPTEPSTERSAA